MTIISGYSIRWNLLFRQALFWLFAELTLNLIGIDNLVDCIEYLLTRQKQAATVQPVVLSSTSKNNRFLRQDRAVRIFL
ncbi:MAG: hypothetical protein ACFB2W_00420 [Leptolyngbyaceae cyanobacterium]